MCLDPVDSKVSTKNLLCRKGLSYWNLPLTWEAELTGFVSNEFELNT